MAAYEVDVDDLLKQEPKITSIRIAQILRERDPAFVLGERAVRIYVARRRALLHPKEMFIRQVYVPGDQVQYDFKDITAVIAGEARDWSKVCAEGADARPSPGRNLGGRAAAA